MAASREGNHLFFMAVIAAEREINMAITGIGYGRTLMYEIQKRVSEGTLQSASDVASRFAESLEESAEENDKVLAPVTRGVRLNRRIEGKDKVPYGEMAEDGVIEYNGVVFVCDYDHNRLTLGDTSNEKDCINIPLSGGGSLLVNRNNIDALSKAIGMFSPEDVNRILRALAQDKKIREMEKELDDMENGDNVDSNEETSETPDADKAAETDPAGTAGEPEKRGSESHGADPRENAGDLRQASERRYRDEIHDRQSGIQHQRMGQFSGEVRQRTGCNPGGTGRENRKTDGRTFRRGRLRGDCR